MSTLNIKQGESFSVDGQLLNDDGLTPKPLTGIILTSQVRNQLDDFVDTLTPTVLDEAAGLYRLTAPNGTAHWPVGTLFWDVKEEASGVTRLTETFTINVMWAITQL